MVSSTISGICSVIGSGRLDRLIQIQEKTETIDELGTAIQAWSTLDSVRAQVIPVRGSEALGSAKINTTRANKFIIRHRSINEEHRIRYENENWNILYIREIGRREGLEIIAEVIK